jgi:hypothetical protein
MNDIDLDTLEATARAATPGPRYPTTAAAAMSMNEGERGMVFDSYEPSDRAFFTAFDPPTVLALIARLREAEATIEEASTAIGSVNEWDGHGRADQLDNTRRILSRYKTTKTENGSTPKRRLRSCVEQWPECETGDYDPACCRFPKSCSATVYDDDRVTDADLEPVTDRENGSAEL